MEGLSSTAACQKDVDPFAKPPIRLFSSLIAFEIVEAEQ